MTNKASNILEDLETLRLLAKVVPEYVPSMDEEGVSQAAFELLFAFDEVRDAALRPLTLQVSCRDNLNLASCS